MTNSLKIKEFIKQRISQIDMEYQQQRDPMKKITLTTTRTSFSNILNTYLNEEAELSASYLKHSYTYYHSHSYQQTIYYTQLAKKHSKDPSLLEDALLLNLKSLLMLGRVEEAHDQLTESSKNASYLVSGSKIKQFYELKAEIMQKMDKEEETMKIMDDLQRIIQQRYGVRSLEMGLFIIEKGRKYRAFQRCSEALALMQKGMNVLIEVRYRDQLSISRIYIEMADCSRLLNDLQSEYSSLICGHSMMRQLQGKQKQLAEIMHKIANNLWKRQELQSCLKQLMKIQNIQKHIYGQSSYIVGKTIKKISETLTKLNRKAEAKKYDLQYSRIVSCNDRKGMARDKPLKYIQSKNKQ